MDNENLKTGDLLTQIESVWLPLQLDLLCNLFVLNHPELKLTFPAHVQEFSINANKYFYPDHFENIIKQENNYFKVEDNFNKLSQEEQKVITKSLKALQKKAESLLKRGAWSDSIDNIDIRNKESFRTLYDYCCMMVYICQKRLGKIEAYEIKKTKDFTYRKMINNGYFHLSTDLMRKYFELIGYWTRRMEEKAQRKPSGKGQKNAKENRVKKLTESIKDYVEDHADGFHIDKGIFNEMLCKTFIGAEKTTRNYNTFTTYKKEVEQKLGKQIILEKKRK